MITIKKLKEINSNIPEYPRVASLINIALSTGILKPNEEAKTATKKLDKLKRCLAIILIFNKNVMLLIENTTQDTADMIEANHLKLSVEKIEFYTKRAAKK